MSSSKLIQKDKYSEQSYQMDGFDPKVNDSKYSYTSGRVMKHVYNQYATQNKPKVFGYYTDWSQYDKRASESHSGAIPQEERGRGIDITLLSPTAYDKLIIGFMGIVGDEGENKSKLERAADWTGKKKNEMTLLDPWGCCQSSFNNGFKGWMPFGFGPAGSYNDGTTEDCFYQEKVQGVLGALRDLKSKAKKQGHDLALSFSVGGWTMSHVFHELAKSDSAVDTLSESIVDFFKRFPMFSEIDIDWEFPNGPGNGNPHGPEDGTNYVRLISRLRKTLDKNGLGQVIISIASSANVALLKESNIKGLIDAGLYGINVMSYDFFGTPWAERLSHHTNLYKTANTDFSLQEAVEYLLEQGVDAERINVGYAGYSRSAKGASISTFSPLAGSYDGSGTTAGTFESGCVEWYDVISNYLDLENQRGRNGYRVYTDAEACADYLYNPDTKVFHSIDTPRTVREKARYVIEKGLGGLFTWTIEQDNGVLLNAAREGMNCSCIRQAIDMAPFYFCGENIKASDDHNPGPDPEINSAPHVQVSLKCVSGSRLTFSAMESSDPDNDQLTFSWSATGGAMIVSPAKPETDIIMPAVVADTLIQVTVRVNDGHGHQTSETFRVSVNGEIKQDDSAGSKDDRPSDGKDDRPEDKEDNTSGSGQDYPRWDPNANYSGGTRVSHKGTHYLAKWWISAGTEPGLSSTTGAANGDALPWTRI